MNECKCCVLANLGCLCVLALHTSTKEAKTVVKSCVYQFHSAENGFKASASTTDSLIIAHRSDTRPSKHIVHATGSVLDQQCVGRQCCVVGPRHYKPPHSEEPAFCVCDVQKDGAIQVLRRLEFNPNKLALTKSQDVTSSQADVAFGDLRTLGVKLYDGLNICFTLGNHLVYSTTEQSSNELQTHDLAVTLGLHDARILWVGSSKQRGNTSRGVSTVLLLLGKPTLASAVQEDNVSDTIVVAAQISTELSSSRIERLAASNFIPQVYAPVVLCAKVLCLWNILITPNSVIDNLASGDPGQQHACKEVFANQTLICTDHGQLLRFDTGKPTDVVELPFQDASDIFILDCSLDGTHIGIQSKCGAVCIVSASTFQVLHVYDNMLPVLTDDFLGCGTEQLLLFPSEAQPQHDSTDWCPKFLLTDYSQHCVDKLQGDAPEVRESQTCNESLEAAAKALHTRLQTGVTALGETQRQIEIRGGLVEQTCATIQQMTLGTEQDCRKTAANAHLVPLLPEPTNGVEATHSTETGDSTEVVSHCPEVISIWWKLVDGSLVVVAEVNNCTARSLHKLHQVVTSSSRSQLNYRPLTMSTLHDETHTQATVLGFKRRKLDLITPLQHGTHTDGVPAFGYAYAAGALPLAGLGSHSEMQLSVAVAWLEETAPAGGIDAPSIWKSRSVEAGSVVVSIQEVLSGTFDVPVEPTEDMSAQEVHRNQLVLDIVQEELTLALESRHSSLSSVHTVLEALGAHMCTPYHCYMYTRPGPLHRVRVKVKCNIRTQVTMSVYARDEAQLLLFVQALYHQLPDDVTVQPTNQTDQHRDLRDIIHAMHQEISLGVVMTEAAKVQDRAARMETMQMDCEDVTEPNNNVESVDKIRKTFTQKQARLKRSVPETSQDIGIDQKTELLKVSAKTDASVLKAAFSLKRTGHNK